MDKTRYEQWVGRWEGKAVAAVVEPMAFMSAVLDVRSSGGPTAKPLSIIVRGRRILSVPSAVLFGSTSIAVAIVDVLDAWNGNARRSTERWHSYSIAPRRAFRSTRVATVWVPKTTFDTKQARSGRVHPVTYSRAAQPLGRQRLQRRV